MQDGLSFDELLASTNSDYLQVAEYLYLKHDRQIGPIRQQIERSFSAEHRDPTQSAAHVELVNLGAKQIYTTNYDDLVESTYRLLGIDHTPVILPKDVALADSNTTQIVKYHGDLAHERTLVLTESSYFKRLDFESPMDLKFRSDLLGKSVLFMGYSFRDVNIRIIWFKLMDMMRDIPEADRRPSYIVRLASNPALEELYAAVGLKTIVLPKSTRESDRSKEDTPLARFLFDLTVRARSHERSARNESTTGRLFVSAEAIRRADELAGRYESLAGGRFRSSLAVGSGGDPVLNRMFVGHVPKALQSQWRKVILRLLPLRGVDEASLAVIASLPASTKLTEFATQILGGVADEEVRAAKRKLIAVPELWRKIWSRPISPIQALDTLSKFIDEIRYQTYEGADEDIAFLADLATRLKEGVLEVTSGSEELTSLAQEAVELAAETYPAISTMDVDGQSWPRVDDVLEQVRARADLLEKPNSVSARQPYPEKWFELRERVASLTQAAERRPPRSSRGSARGGSR
nr:SIR2 family protein [Curtobacterium pusillum]